MKRTLAALASLLLLLSQQAGAKVPVRMRFGVDWGYSPQLYHAFTSTYFTQIGYRVTEESHGFKYYTNAYLMAGLGCELGNRCAVYLKSGYMGLFEDFRVMPLLGEVQYFFKEGHGGDTPFLLLNGGIALHSGNFDDKTVLASLGGGYRYHLSQRSTLDIVAKLQGCNCSPLPYDVYEGLVPRSSIIYSNAHYFALSLGISLYF